LKKPRILIVDDDADIRDILKLTLSGEDYEVIEAADGMEGLKMAQGKSPDLVILDYKMPYLDGREVCRRLKKDILLRHLPVIMLTGKGDLTDKIKGIDAGADDYIVKPFEPAELLARARMILRRTERDLEANPLTRLPGNISIINELQNRVEKKAPLAVGYVDLDKFKSYNDKYGFEHGDEVLRETARTIITAINECGNSDDFIGHIGGDDFVFITTPDKSDKVSQKLIAEFEKKVPEFYEPEDVRKGYIIAHDRKGQLQQIPLLSISIGLVTNETRVITHVAQVSEIGAELKEAAKRLERSNYIKDKRKET
jgi:diguanylate cyclase (GGDEF)-like protein